MCARTIELPPPYKFVERNDPTEGLAGKYVKLYDFFDWPMEVRWKTSHSPLHIFTRSNTSLLVTE